jgi:hypothetical protein
MRYGHAEEFVSFRALASDSRFLFRIFVFSGTFPHARVALPLAGLLQFVLGRGPLARSSGFMA